MKKEIPGILRAQTPLGDLVPILDITHEAFTEYCDEAALARMSAAAAAKAGAIARLPGFIKALIRRSSNTRDSYLSGMRTLALKLGPRLIGEMKAGFMERRLVHEFSSIALRVRARNMSVLLAEALKPALARDPAAGLILANIAGGPASDSINAIRLLAAGDRAAGDRALLAGRRIEIVILDIDRFGPEIARSSVEVLKRSDPLFADLELSARHIPYDWNDTRVLRELLDSTQGAIRCLSSEGGLFEYGSDEAIAENLEAMARGCGPDDRIVGSIMLEIGCINPMMVEMRKITRTSLRFLGIDGLGALAAASGWEIERARSDGSIYASFALKKRSVG